MPRIHNVEGYDRDLEAVYHEPLSYVRYHKATPPEWKATIEYIADNEDEVWLRSNSKFGEAAPAGFPRLSLTVFENMLDILEKETAFDSIITTHQADLHYQQRLPQLLRTFPLKARQVGESTYKMVTNEVYNYWVQKRSKLKRPLLRRFWPVTSTEDTNPHLVFRPREKEKYKLRKKRQNDANAYRKMKQLRDDFDNLRAVLDLVRKREEVYRMHVQLEIEQFEQRLYDATNTTGKARVSNLEEIMKIEHTLKTIPKHFDLQQGGRNVKRTRNAGIELPGSKRLSPTPGPLGGSSSAGTTPNIAGRNQGTPAPNFLHPLHTREGYVSSWDGAVPHASGVIGSAESESPIVFRHRPRIGRGGRVIIDRIPQPPPPANVARVKVYRAGIPLPRSLEPQTRLLDLLPKPIDEAALSRKIDIAMAAMKSDDRDGGEDDDNDASIAKLDEWLSTDEQLWGEERHMLGPF